MKFLLAFLFLVIGRVAWTQSLNDTIRLHFLYGSIPAKGYEKTEPKFFGGLKGGHVSIEANGRVLDFLPGNCPILPENNRPSGGFRINKAVYWDTSSTKWVMIKIPLTRSQLESLETIYHSYAEETPYDYAVFGMRCAAASYDVLSEIGLFKKVPEKFNMVKNFYPKLFRKRILKWAGKNNYPVIFHPGKPTRKWESDEGIF
ncbi:MAG TPA: hypothetical protein VFX58_16890 [Chitinophagaceae bacterium]|nr:hypothetical protein [Chitinophagaceae bacterium]